MTPYDTLPDTTRVWVYQSNRPFRDEDIPEIRSKAQAFAQSWISHNRQLRAHADVLHNRFVVLMVDESRADASGCSIDKSVYFLKQLQAEYGVDLFDRMAFSYMDGEEVATVPRETFARLYQESKINGDTLVFDTLVSTKEELDRNWLKPLNQSWHRRMV